MKWVNPEITSPGEAMELMVRRRMERMSDYIEHILLYHDFMGYPHSWHPKPKWTKPELRPLTHTVLIWGIPFNHKAGAQIIRLLGKPIACHPGETCADFCKASKCTAMLLKDDPRCRIKLGG